MTRLVGYIPEDGDRIRVIASTVPGNLDCIGHIGIATWFHSEDDDEVLRIKFEEPIRREPTERDYEILSEMNKLFGENNEDVHGICDISSILFSGSGVIGVEKVEA